MVSWILAIAVTVLACATLYYAAARRPVNATGAAGGDATTAHFRLQLKEIDGDIAAGRLGQLEGQAARGEMARELVRLQAEEARRRSAGARRQLPVLMLATGLSAVLALAAYGWLGNPTLPAAPLAARTAPAMMPDLDLDEALAQVEAQLAETPNDVRGWAVVAPVYMQQGRFAKAAEAYRRVLELAGATADIETDLGEAIMMAQDGDATGEPLALFASAAARDPEHVRSRFYLASEAMRAGAYARAATWWREVLALAQGGESWETAAQAGLEAATAALAGAPAAPDGAAISQMVEGLADRLARSGGSIEEWTQLVRSRLVLGQSAAAQAAYDAARKAFPDPAARTELDVLAADNGLVAREASE